MKLLLGISILCSFSLSAQNIPLPENYQVLDTISGDLNRDGKKELVVAYNTKKEVEYESIPRELQIYKMEDGKWILWKISKQALYGSRDGGLMGDPYDGMKINNGILIVRQDGGSSWKWGQTDKYRFQDGDFYLIGFSSMSGKNCEYWEETDINLMTGKIVVNKEYEKCEDSEQETYKVENETYYKKGLKITLQNRHEKEIKVVTPKFKHKIIIASPQE